MEEVNRKHGALNGMHGMLASKWAFRLLLCLNALATLIVLWSSRGTILSDTWSYLGLAEGIRHGEYSMWWRLPGEYPDTFRTPGYPLFIALFLHVFASWRSVLVVQFFLYVLALWLALRTLRLLDGRPATRGLFLLLLLPLVNVPFYIGQLYADIPVLVAIGAVVWLVVRAPKWTWSTAVAVGLLMGFVFQCKPIFLLFPFLFVPAAWCVERSWANVRAHLLMLAVFLGTVLPFGFWSLKHHGVFKVTPLEGAGSYMHIGYWSGKTPGYQDEFYLHNFNGDELVRFTPKDSVPANVEAYRREWRSIKAQLDPLLTAKDSLMREKSPQMPYPAEPTYNTAYTMLREKLLFQNAVQHYLHDPVYTVTFKAWSAVRLWVIGIQVREFREATVLGKVKMLHATVSTGVVFLLFLVFVPWAYAKRRLSFRATWPLALYLLYCTAIHLPFTIQSRYTVCVRFLMLILLAMAITGLLQGREGRTEAEVTEE